MKISQLYTYPIKSLREVPLTTAEVTKHGFPYDRRFMLFKATPEATPTSLPYAARMTVTYCPAMTLFRQEIIITTTSKPPTNSDASGNKDESFVRVTYTAPSGGGGGAGGKQAQIEIPLRPDVATLQQLDVELHQSPTKAYNMGSPYNDWFSAHFGFDTILIYLGPHLRPILGNLAPPAAQQQNSGSSSWLFFSSIARQLPLIGGGSTANNNIIDKEGLTFADVAAYLVVTEESLADVSARLADGLQADMTKFRPNIVLSGAGTAYDEDFWAELGVVVAEKAPHAAAGDEKENSGAGAAAGVVVFDLTQNCARCKSLNIDYGTGEFGKGEVGSVLKKMMRDRRVDKGNRWSPIFGRYGFLRSSAGQSISIGDEVEVLRRNEERTTFVWPGMGSRV